MQTFEASALILFVVSYLFGALRSYFTPEVYRQEELQFYKSGKPSTMLLVSFLLASAAFVMLIVHFILEDIRIGQLVLYYQVILFEIVFPFHFMPFFRDRMVKTLTKKTAADYRKHGLKRLAIAVVIIALPFIYPVLAG